MKCACCVARTICSVPRAGAGEAGLPPAASALPPAAPGAGDAAGGGVASPSRMTASAPWRIMLRRSFLLSATGNQCKKEKEKKGRGTTRDVHERWRAASGEVIPRGGMVARQRENKILSTHDKDSEGYRGGVRPRFCSTRRPCWMTRRSRCSFMRARSTICSSTAFCVRGKAACRHRKASKKGRHTTLPGKTPLARERQLLACNEWLFVTTAWRVRSLRGRVPRPQSQVGTP